MTIGPEQPGSSEQPDSFGEMSRRDAVANFNGLVYGGLDILFGMEAVIQRSEGNSRTADKLEEIAEGFKLRGILERSGVMSDLRGMIPRVENPEIIEGEIIETRRELE